MSLTMKQKQAVTKQLALSYNRARKKQKGEILDTLIALTGYNRSYAGNVLRQRARHRVVGRLRKGGVNIALVEDERTKRKRPPRRRQRKYDKQVVVALRKVWVICEEYLWEEVRPLPFRDRPTAGTAERARGQQIRLQPLNSPKGAHHSE